MKKKKLIGLEASKKWTTVESIFSFHLMWDLGIKLTS